MPVEPPVVSPYSLREAYELLAEQPHRPLAGGTDLLVQLTGELGPPPERVIDLWQVDELRGIAIRGEYLELGALTTYTDIRRSPICREHLPALVEAAATIGAAQIQHRGTIGGNVMNASPAGDMLPVLLALDAILVVGGQSGEREIPAADVLARVPPDGRQTRRAAGPRPDPARDGPRAAVPEGGHAPGAGDLEGRRRGGLARDRTRGGTCGSRSGPSPRRRSGFARPRPPSRAGRATSPPSMPPSTRWATRSGRSTTSGRPPPIGARPRAGSSGACSPICWRRRDRARREPLRQAVHPARAGRPRAGPSCPRPDGRRRARGRVRRRVRRRRQRARRRDRHDEEHRLRLRDRAPERGDRAVRTAARDALRRAGGGRARDGLDPRARLGAAADGGRPGARCLPAVGRHDADGGCGRRCGRRGRRQRRRGPRRDEDRPIGVQRVSARRVHDAAGGPRPDHGDEGDRDLAPRHGTGRLGRPSGGPRATRSSPRLPTTTASPSSTRSG